jgi:hypothetical protein
MKKISYGLCFACLFVFFISCDKEEKSQELTPLNFSLNFLDVEQADVNNFNKNHLDDFPVCSTSPPQFVGIVLEGPTNVGTLENPVFVEVKNTPEDYDGDGKEEFVIKDAPELKLRPGTYILKYFAVYDGVPSDEASNLSWIAPTSSTFSTYVPNPLPIEININSGDQKFIGVDIFCFDNRDLN